MPDGTLRITRVADVKVLAPEGVFDPFPTAANRHRCIDVAGWRGVAWRASQYLPVGEYEFTWIEEDEND